MSTSGRVNGRRRWLIALLVAVVSSTPELGWAGGWYWVVPPPGPASLYPGPDWAVAQAFETLARCEEMRRREYGKGLDEARRLGKGLSEYQRSSLAILFDPSVPPDLKDRMIPHLAKDPQLNESMVNIAAGNLIKKSVCLASDDPRVQNSPMWSAPLLPPAMEKPIAKGGATIRYTPGRPILVTVRLNDRVSARLILDTGADRSMIGLRALVGAGVDLTRPMARGEVRGVGGKTEVLFYRLDSIGFGDARVQQLPVAAYDLGENNSDGLLGRDFLDRFTVMIDPASGIVRLTPK